MRTKSPVAVLQIETAGSNALYASLRQQCPDRQIFKTRLLSWSSIRQAETYHRQILGGHLPEHVQTGRQVRAMLDASAGAVRWKFITIVQEPVERAILEFFHHLDVVLPDVPTMSESTAADRIAQCLRDYFNGFNAEADYLGRCLHKELKEGIGLDLGSLEFSHDHGYGVYQAPSADVLILRKENYGDVAEPSMRSFLNMPDFTVPEAKPAHASQRLLIGRSIDKLVLANDTVERIYRAPGNRFFYSAEEIHCFKQKWVKAAPKVERHHIPVDHAAGGPQRRIMVIHQEGNLNNNPHLSGIIEILCENGYLVDYYGIKRDFAQVPPCAGVRTVLKTPIGRTVTNGFVSLSNSIVQDPDKTVGFVKDTLPAYELVIGIDRSIIEAELIARLKNIPCGLISYEIYFLKETNAEFKQLEIAACRGLEFAVCQDRVRAVHLARENRIHHDKIINIPMGGRQAHEPRRSDYLRKTLGIDARRKIALIIGSLAKWTMTDFIISSFAQWPQDWSLVIHNRYGFDADAQFYFERYGHIRNIHFSKTPAATPAEMKPIIQSADIGLALYAPQPNDIWAGDNIKHIGMASGKIATFFQYGLPVIVNQIGAMSANVQRYDLGMVVDSSRPIMPPTDEGRIRSMRFKCHAFYKEHLDLDVTMAPLLRKIQALLPCEPEKNPCRPLRINPDNFHAGARLHGQLQG